MFPGLAGVGNMVSAPVAGPVDMAGTRCWQWTALEGVQVGEEGMSFQCSYTGLYRDSGTELTEIESLEDFGLAVGDRLKHSQVGTRQTCSDVDIVAGLRRDEPAVADNLNR